MLLIIDCPTWKVYKNTTTHLHHPENKHGCENIYRLFSSAGTDKQVGIAGEMDGAKSRKNTYEPVPNSS